MSAAPPGPKGLAKDLVGKRVVVMLGAGGVGKTTTAISVAMLGAQAGRKVALLSIDPAKRLAAALGIPLGNQLRRVEIPAALGVPGSVDAAMLDQKAVFDTMVRRQAPSDDVAERILAHPVYKAASTNLAGPLEYMALAKLQELADDHRYDLVVLDTPPDTHALDFLERPNVLAGFMDNKVMSWLVKPFLIAGRFGLGRVLNVGERLMGGVAKVTGVAALKTFGEFLVLIQEVIEGFHKSGERIIELLHKESTGFLLVTVPTSAAARSAGHIADELARLGYHCDALVFNRCLPRAVAEALDAVKAVDDPALAGLKRRLDGERGVIDALRARITAKHRQRGGDEPDVHFVADHEKDLNDLDAILALARELGGAAAEP
jgi:anion-transporting  ArsA/GET3 family ATPase